MHSTSATRGISTAPVATGEMSLLEKYLAVRQTSMRLCAPLTVEDHSLQPMPDASPSKWHLAHTTWFFETFLLSEYLKDYRPFQSAFRSLFNSYYNAVGDRPLRALRHILSRPGLDEVHAYREHVDDAMVQFLSRDPGPEVLDLVVLGINHEQQHQELIITDVKNGLWTNPLRPAYRPTPVGRESASAAAQSSHLDWRNFRGGVYPVGFEGEGFTFDNEGPRHDVYLGPFRLASRLATNAEYLEFMRDGGYSKAELWLSDGWDCIHSNQWTAPSYWEQRDGEWWSYTIEGMKPLDLNEPVCHVSYYEADAFARWSGKDLPTEEEWEVAAKSGGLSDAFGIVWQWTRGAYTPYPGYQAAPGALGEYNGKFMVNQMVLRGSSLATPAGHSRPSYRNFFYPSARWQFSGLRLAQYEH